MTAQLPGRGGAWGGGGRGGAWGGGGRGVGWGGGAAAAASCGLGCGLGGARSAMPMTFIRRSTCAGMGPSAVSPMASFALLTAVSIGVSGCRVSSLLISLSFSPIGS